MARIEIPPALAYGKDGIPGSSVPPDETLVFEVEILGVR
jgi:FKBP-type peptidyl-prolyl cis-trans isomerase